MIQSMKKPSSVHVFCDRQHHKGLICGFDHREIPLYSGVMCTMKRGHGRRINAFSNPFLIFGVQLQ